MSRLLIDVSMVTREEIAMIVIQRGRSLGTWVIRNVLVGAMVFVSLARCIVTPRAARPLLCKLPRTQQSP